MLDPHLPINELLDSLSDHIADLVYKRLVDAGIGAGQPEELQDEHSMAAVLGVSQQTLERLRKQGKVPCVRLGRRVLYRHQAVLEALSETATGGSES